MNPSLIILVLAAVIALLVGREVGRWAFDSNEKLSAKRRAAQKLAGKLRDAGLKIIPSFLEAFASGDVKAMIEQVHDVAKVVEAGSDAIEKELENVFENALTAKLSTPEGLMLIRQKIADVEKLAAK